MGHFSTPLAYPAVPWWLTAVPWRHLGVLPHTCTFEFNSNDHKRNLTQRLGYMLVEKFRHYVSPLAHPVVPWWMMTLDLLGRPSLSKFEFSRKFCQAPQSLPLGGLTCYFH